MLRVIKAWLAHHVMDDHVNGAARVAVVTGSNKGIGFEIVRRLCKEFDGDVYLTARDTANGLKAIAQLEAEGLRPKFHQLDITSQASVENLKQHLVQMYGGLDVLVNNAGVVCERDSSPIPFSEKASITIATNFTGTLCVTRALFPLIRPHGRIVNVSSEMGESSVFNEPLRGMFRDPSLTEEGLVALMDQYLKDVKDGCHAEKGWPNMSLSAFRTSKVGVTALAKVYAREAARLGKDTILVNACCPGWCQTDMFSQIKAPFSAAEGADTPVYLALLPADSASGEYWIEKAVAVW